MGYKHFVKNSFSKVAIFTVALLTILLGSTSHASAQQDLFDPDPPVAGETTSITIGPIEQSVGYSCISFNLDGSCATYRICPSPSSVSYRITFRSPTGETFVVNLDSTFTAADPYPPAPDGGVSGEFMLTGEFEFPDAGTWEYQSQITRTNICGSSQTAVSQWTEFDVAEDATVPVVHPAGVLAIAALAVPGYFYKNRRKFKAI